MIDEKARERLLTLGRELVFLLEERLPQDDGWEIEVGDALAKLRGWTPKGPLWGGGEARGVVLEAERLGKEMASRMNAVPEEKPVRKAVVVAEGMVLANDGSVWAWIPGKHVLGKVWERIPDLPQD